MEPHTMAKIIQPRRHRSGRGSPTRGLLRRRERWCHSLPAEGGGMPPMPKAAVVVAATAGAAPAAAGGAWVIPAPCPVLARAMGARWRRRVVAAISSSGGGPGWPASVVATDRPRKRPRGWVPVRRILRAVAAGGGVCGGGGGAAKVQNGTPAVPRGHPVCPRRTRGSASRSTRGTASGTAAMPSRRVERRGHPAADQHHEPDHK